jgi:hypothetical protein
MDTQRQAAVLQGMRPTHIAKALKIGRHQPV